MMIITNLFGLERKKKNRWLILIIRWWCKMNWNWSRISHSALEYLFISFYVFEFEFLVFFFRIKFINNGAAPLVMKLQKKNFLIFPTEQKEKVFVFCISKNSKKKKKFETNNPTYQQHVGLNECFNESFK